MLNMKWSNPEIPAQKYNYVSPTLCRSPVANIYLTL